MFVKCFLKDRVVLVNVGSFRTHVHVLISDDRSTTRSYLLRVYLKILRRDVSNRWYIPPCLDARSIFSILLRPVPARFLTLKLNTVLPTRTISNYSSQVSNP
jgi:predicted AAA+ superfamily ATPase